MATNNIQIQKRLRLKTKIRSRINGTKECPRLSVYKSNMHIYAQLIDDVAGKTLCTSSDIKESVGTYRERAIKVGQEIAALAQKQGITSVVFDRNGYKYTGHIAALADAARGSGLKF